MTRYYDEYAVGERKTLGAHEFTREAILEFARQWDPQRFHVDEQAAKASMFGALCASGWHTACIAMRLIVGAYDEERRQRAEAGLEIPVIGVSPGVRNLRWPVPTFPGDVLTYYSEVLSTRETKRPQWGLVSSRTWAVNQRGEEAFSMEGAVVKPRREAAGG